MSLLVKSDVFIIVGVNLNEDEMGSRAINIGRGDEVDIEFREVMLGGVEFVYALNGTVPRTVEQVKLIIGEGLLVVAVQPSNVASLNHVFDFLLFRVDLMFEQGGLIPFDDILVSSNPVCLVRGCYGVLDTLVSETYVLLMNSLRVGCCFRSSFLAVSIFTSISKTASLMDGLTFMI